ncbi:B2 bradykinin receptor-like [Hyla sarda]|uniref:B2 bradykinin receptor-like n=1 Tax=Hyla sarda TaxID=327740 RepID=UPI0024C29146|nr:B2 bradykinin receptor-like [Hyla sarda]
MFSLEPNRTMTLLVNITETPNNRCIDQKHFDWLFTYRPHYIWIIFVLGIIENLFVIFVFVLHKSRCTVTEIYLGNLAAADLIFISSHPFWAIYISKDHWPFGGIMCAAVGSSFKINLYSRNYLLMMVSIERYLALVKTMTIGRLRRPWWAKVNCGIIWMFTAGLNVPTGVFRKEIFNKKFNTTACRTDAPSQNWYVATNILMNVLGFFVPLVVTAFCTSRMIQVLRNNLMRQFKKVNTERKATRLVLSVFLVFIVCCLPYNIYIFIKTLYTLQIFPPCIVKAIRYNVYPISIYLVYSNSCINPVIYSMVGNQFRQKAREVYSRLLCKRPDRRTS